MEYLDHPTVFAMALFFAFMIGGSIVQWIFLIRLKRLDWEIWVRAGRPTIWSGRDLIRAWPTIKFLLGKNTCSLVLELVIGFVVFIGTHYFWGILVLAYQLLVFS